MDDDATWYGSRSRHMPHCIRRGPSCPRKGHSTPPLFAHVCCGHGRPSQLLSSCTKYDIAIPIPDKSAVTAAQVLIDNFFLKVGCPQAMLTDNRKEFENALFRKLCSGLDILKLHTTCNQSRSNGCVERWCRSLNAMLGKVVQTHQTDWPSHVPFVVNAYSTMTHSSTNYTPFFLMFGREQQIPLDILLCPPMQGGQKHTVSEDRHVHVDESGAESHAVCSRMFHCPSCTYAASAAGR